MGKERGKETPEEVPSAITLLRKMEVQYRGPDVCIPRGKWDELEAVLLPCSEGEYPHLIKCEVCLYSEECHAIQDLLSGKAKKKVKYVQADQAE